MLPLRLQLSMIAATMIIFALALAANEWLLPPLEFTRGVNWIYLPAGIRLLCTLLFAEAGAIGLLLVSWLVCFFYFFPDDPVRSFMGGVLASAAPYLVYRLAKHVYQLHASLINLTPKRLLFLVVAYSVASPLLHHIWFFLRGEQDQLMQRFAVMLIGDLAGTLIVIYAAKFLLSFFPARRPGPANVV